MSSRSSAEGAGLPSPDALAIHLDLVGGLAGDMFVAAMVDALPALAAPVLAAAAAVRPPGAPEPRFVAAASGGLRAVRLTLDGGGARGAAYRTVAGAGRRRAPGARDDHPGTAYATLRQRIEAASLAAATRAHALAILALLARAEASVHGSAVEDVHFHELADWDSLLDVVAAGCIAGLLDGARWTASAPPLGGGTVRTAHGTLPVPTPATVSLLTGYPWHDDGVGGERVTPTGAAILRHLVAPQDCAARRAAGVLLAAGSGCGTRTLPGLPNVVRVLVTERRLAVDPAVPDTPAFARADGVVTLEFDVDDMTGEEIALAADHLRGEAGVLDVSVGTRFGKKGRAVADFRVLARPEALDGVARACFGETTTLGLRLRDERRFVLPRTESTEAAGDARLRVKVAARPDGTRTAKTEHDDVAAQRGLRKRRAARAAAAQVALKRSPA